MKRLLPTLAVLLLLTTPVVAQDFQRGVEAYESGDYATALRVLRPYAEQGNTDAQRTLGLMYALGQGVPQDYVQALMWLNLAAAQGDNAAIKTRDSFKGISPAVISKAKRMAREWLEAHPQ